MTNADKLSIARTVFAQARATGADAQDALDAVWNHARKIDPSLNAARAPHGLEALARNTSARKSYRSPVGDWLGLTGGDYGHHSAKWPRTKRSLLEREELLRSLVETLTA